MKCKAKTEGMDWSRCKRPPVESLSDEGRKTLIELGYIKNGEYVSEG